MIAKLNRLKEIDGELVQIAENRKAVRVLENGYRQERAMVIEDLRKLGISIARVRKPSQKKEKAKKTAS